jgi:hypothetical protein
MFHITVAVFAFFHALIHSIFAAERHCLFYGTAWSNTIFDIVAVVASSASVTVVIVVIVIVVVIVVVVVVVVVVVIVIVIVVGTLVTNGEVVTEIPLKLRT